MNPLVAAARIAWQGVTRRPGRNALTAISLLVGVLAIVLIQSGAATARDVVIADAVLANGQAPTVRADFDGGPATLLAGRAVAQHLSGALAPWNGAAATVVRAPFAAVEAGGTVLAVDASVVYGDLRAIRPFPFVSGGWFPAEPAMAPAVVLNEPAAAQLAGSALHLSLGTGDSVSATLAGVVYDGGRDPHVYVDGRAPHPMVAQAAAAGVPSVLVHAEGVPADFVVGRAHEVAALSGSGFAFTSAERVDSVDEFSRQIGTIRLVFVAVAALSLLVGSLGILNVGLSALRERSDELSLRRAMGATRLQVVALMIAESQIVAALASAAAIAVAILVFPWAVDRLAPDYTVIEVGFPASAGVAGIGASALAALAGSLAPALRAARVPIASIMRG